MRIDGQFTVCVQLQEGGEEWPRTHDLLQAPGKDATGAIAACSDHGAIQSTKDFEAVRSAQAH